MLKKKFTTESVKISSTKLKGLSMGEPMRITELHRDAEYAYVSSALTGDL